MDAWIVLSFVCFGGAVGTNSTSFHEGKPQFAVQNEQLRTLGVKTIKKTKRHQVLPIRVYSDPRRDE